MAAHSVEILKLGHVRSSRNGNHSSYLLFKTNKWKIHITAGQLITISAVYIYDLAIGLASRSQRRTGNQ